MADDQQDVFSMTPGAPVFDVANPRKIKRSILLYLEQNAKGKKNAVTSDTIAYALGLNDGTSTSFRLRAFIKSMIEDGHLIASCGKGFFLIETREELDDYVASLTSRRDGIDTRIENLLQNWNCFQGK